MEERVPLSTLLSQVLIAFTIEFDNEFERQMPHRITVAEPEEKRAGVPWLVSMVMWSNLMRFVDPHGISAREFAHRARLDKDGARQWLARMRRWGYLTVRPDPAKTDPSAPSAGWRVAPTRAGRHAQELWRPLGATIEARWETRFGDNAIAELRAALQTLVNASTLDAPEYLPIAGYGWFTNAHMARRRAAESKPPTLQLAALLSHVLFELALEFDRDADVSLALGANTLRVFSTAPTPMRDLPQRTGISKEAIAVSAGYLERGGFAQIESAVGARGKAVRLTAGGRRAQENVAQKLRALEDGWGSRFGKIEVNRVREAATAVLEATDRNGGEPLLAAGLRPHPGGWRGRAPYIVQTTAMLRNPRAALPHYPLVLHRGGFPDGS